MSDSFATAPRLDSTTLTLRIYPKPPTDQPPTVFSPSHSLRLLLFSSLFSVVSHPLAAAAATRALSPYVDQATNSSPYACLPACFPIPHSILFVVARTLREKVTSARVASPKTPQTPAGTRLHPVALSVVVVFALGGTRRKTSDVGKLGFRANRDDAIPLTIENTRG